MPLRGHRVEINFFLQNFSNFLRARPVAAAPTEPPAAESVQPNRVDLLRARRQLVRIFESLQEIDRLINGKSTILAGLATARSNPALALNLTPSAALLRSVEEINTTPTSFSPFVPGWNLGSSALLNFAGIYDGSQGSGALNYEVSKGGVHGQDLLRIRFRDTQGGILRNITINPNDPLDQQYTLNNGLFFTLGGGNLANNDSSALQVFDNIGSTPDPDKAFDGTGNDNPNLQFGLPAVIDGTFQLNGETISISSGDSINDVLDKINQSNAGVAATFDAGTERIELVQNTTGSLPTIDIQSDTSNFLQAVKLDTAIATPGTDADNERPMSDVAQFSSVQSGSFLVNGESISVDPSTDSLDDVIARINASAAAVTASLDPATKELVITGDSEAEFMTIDGNATGFFASTNIPEGIIESTGQVSGFSQRHAVRVAAAIEDGIQAMNEFFSNQSFFGSPGSQVAALRSQLKSAFISVLGSAGPTLDTGIGIVVNLDGVAKGYVRFARVDAAKLVENLQYRSGAVKRLFSGSRSDKGLIQAVGEATQRALQSLNSTLGTRGIRIDSFA
jgi:hypothetical protein